MNDSDWELLEAEKLRSKLSWHEWDTWIFVFDRIYLYVETDSYSGTDR